MKKALLALALVSGIVGCQREDVVKSYAEQTTISKVEKGNTVLNNAGDEVEMGMAAFFGETKIPFEQVKKLAIQEMAENLKSEGKLTKAGNLQIESVEAVRDGKQSKFVETKGGGEQASDYYIINFADDKGYVIASGDRRLPRVIGYNTSGKLGRIEDMKEGQKVVFEMIRDYVQARKAYFEQNRDRLEKETADRIFKNMDKKNREKAIAAGIFSKDGKYLKTRSKLDCDEFGYAERETIDKYFYFSKCDKLLNTEWKQDGGYNDKIETYCSDVKDEAPVGCVAIAVGQIMAYHKKPAKFLGRDMHWDEMVAFNTIEKVTDRAKDDIRYLLAELGKEDNKLLEMKYSCLASSSNINFALESLKKLGYKDVKREKYSSDIVVSNLDKKEPLYIRGLDEEKGGHAWILDGYIKEKSQRTKYSLDRCREIEYNDGTYIFEQFMVHNNFGNGNGSCIWLDEGVFNISTEKGILRFNFGNGLIVNIH